MLHPGLYEQLINHTLRQELESIPPERKVIASVDPAEAAEMLSRYIAEAAKRALSDIAEREVSSSFHNNAQSSNSISLVFCGWI